MSTITLNENDEIKYGESIERIAFAMDKFKALLDDDSCCFQVSQTEPLAQQILTIEDSISNIESIIKNRTNLLNHNQLQNEKTISTELEETIAIPTKYCSYIIPRVKDSRMDAITKAMKFISYARPIDSNHTEDFEDGKLFLLDHLADLAQYGEHLNKGVN